jgi:hypothetical protein
VTASFEEDSQRRGSGRKVGYERRRTKMMERRVRFFRVRSSSRTTGASASSCRWTYPGWHHYVADAARRRRRCRGCFSIRIRHRLINLMSSQRICKEV